MRTREEILSKYRESTEIFDFAPEVLSQFLDFEAMEPFLKEGSETQWVRGRLQTPEEAGYYPITITDGTWVPPSDETALAMMASYMKFAWGKVEDHRGISASRSVDKLSAYVWLLGNDALYERLKDIPYAMYGAPKLAAICKEYNLPIPDDEGIELMIGGSACSLYCESC